MRNKQKLVLVLLDIVIGVLSVILVGAIAFAVYCLQEDFNYSYSEDSFYYRLEDEEFGAMVEMYHANEAAGAKASANMKEYYGVAKYVEAASFYKMYMEAGDMEKADRYRERMQEAASEMGELAFLQERLCEKLGVVTP